ncbi:2-C-methyl-D-erythritol 2,4-cyclodiphosphate synthase [Balneicella halophila]|uniref:2-C-methyl-D-erythritol 2,4-cyclodiphosphate synthase n=1 Tax=Balneicella halophila TaxID=1537566 RepID=A0A7L4UQG2_BALHA|nr:2-C-methyl-D-erythritol 2,4-cyclodiphosphate synthase [Balneicella halophila]PVX49980.1 2-C-methyl-D-erythritol 2,4-cyclodiphosphate synthase [Balneicella halophila]
MNLRIGQGYDVHKLAAGYEFWLGGILIPYELGSVGHSDGDVLIHAICDAILGAACLRDIGYHFPDTDNAYKNIDSKILLQDTLELIKKEGYYINNIDATVCLQKPKVKDYIPKMRDVLAEILEIDKNTLSIKATTTEQLGFVGRREGVEAHAVVLLIKE